MQVQGCACIACISSTSGIHIQVWADPSVDIWHISRRQNGWNFSDNIFKCILVNENHFISIQISLKFVHKGSSYHKSALVQIKTWRQIADTPLLQPSVDRDVWHNMASLSNNDAKLFVKKWTRKTNDYLLSLSVRDERSGMFLIRYCLSPIQIVWWFTFSRVEVRNYEVPETIRGISQENI